MGELTYLMVLGAIALIFPIVVVSVYGYVNQDVNETMLENIYYSDNAQYQTIKNANCSNIYEETDFGMTTFELIRNYRIDFFLPENQYWMSKWDIGIGCYFNNGSNPPYLDYVEAKINETLLAEDEINNYLITEEEKKERGIFYSMNPKDFFNALGEFPSSIQIFIYGFYGILLSYIIWRSLPFT
jgi:hypothetical protein